MASAWRMYVKLATNHPLKVNVVAGFFLAYAGDIVCQHEFESGKGYLGIFQDEEKARKWKWNKERSLELGVLRACLLGPWTHIYYPFLMRTIKGPYLYHAMGRAFLDQFIGSPIVITLVFFGSDFYNMKYSRDLSIVDNLKYTINRLMIQGPNAWLGGAKFWPFVHTLNFRNIPPLHQPMFAHVASIYWNAILSFYNNAANEDLAEEEAKVGEEGAEEGKDKE